MSDDRANRAAEVRSLKGDVVASGGWLLALRFGERVVAIARSVVLARLLVPDDFGLFGMAVLGMALLETVSKTGLDEAAIQKDRPTEEYLGTIWVTHVVRGATLALAIVALAPLLAGFLGDPAATPLMRALAANFLIVGLTNSGVLLLEQRLKFGKLALLGWVGTSVDVLVSIAAAFALRSPWALIFGMLAGSAARVAMSFVVAPAVRPGFRADFFRELIDFGRWVWGANILHFAANQGDDVVVGRYLGAGPLGIYRMAFTYASLPATEVTHVISKVTFPAYARLAGDIGAIRRGYLSTVQMVALIAAPLSLGMSVMADSFTRLVLEPAWEPMVAPLQVLALWGLVRALSSATGPVFLALGRPETITRLVGGRVLVLFALIFPLMNRLGATGAAIAAILASLSTYPMAAREVNRSLECPTGDWVRAFLVPVLSAAAMAGTVVASHRLLSDEFGLTAFFGSIFLGAAVYALLVFVGGPMVGFDALGPLRSGGLRRR